MVAAPCSSSGGRGGLAASDAAQHWEVDARAQRMLVASPPLNTVGKAARDEVRPRPACSPERNMTHEAYQQVLAQMAVAHPVALQDHWAAPAVGRWVPLC